MKVILLIGALVGATCLTYSNTFSASFIHDDIPIIVRNPLIRQLDRIPLIFGTPYWGMSVGHPKEYKGTLYRPLTVATYALNYAWGGLKPKGYHVVNLMIHTGVALLLCLLCRRLGLPAAAAWIGSLLFSVHPIHTEAVSNVIGRAELLSAFFVLLSWICVTGRPSLLQIGLGAVSYGLAILSKENASAFLGVLILADHVMNRKPWKALLQERGLVWLVFAGSFLLYMQWHQLVIGDLTNTGMLPYFTYQNMWTVGLTMSKFMVQHYIVPLVTGTGLCAEFTRPALPDASLTNPANWLYGTAVASLVIASIYFCCVRKNQKAFWVLVFLVFIFPVSNLLIRLEVIGAERFLYLPSIGYCVGLGLLFNDFFLKKDKLIRAGISILLGGLVLLHGSQTIKRNVIWTNEETFWTAALRESPQSPRAWNGFGSVLMSQQKYDEAIHHFKRALSLNPMLFTAYLNLGVCYFLTNEVAQAKAIFSEVLSSNPFQREALLYMASFAEKEKDFSTAANYYTRILSVDPFDRMAQRNLALVHCRMGKQSVCQEELEHYLQAAGPEENNDDLRGFLQTWPRGTRTKLK